MFFFRQSKQQNRPVYFKSYFVITAKNSKTIDYYSFLSPDVILQR